MNGKDGNTKFQLSNSFKSLLLKYPFEKITVKMITDGAGVIRPTFYTYFPDKHAIFEWILEEELVDPLFALIDNDMEQEAFKMIFHYFTKHRNFYSKAFQVKGQNGFEEILTNDLHEFFNRMLGKYELNLEETTKLLTRENLSIFYSKKIITILQFWIMDIENTERDADEVYEVSMFLFSHSFVDIVGK